MQKSAVITLLMLAIGVGAAGGYFLPRWQSQAQTPAPQPVVAAPAPAAPAAPVLVETHVLKESVLFDRLNAVGTLVSEEAVTVRPEIAGRISDIRFHEGQSVRRGDVLLTLDDAVARAELQQARANQALANSKYQRANELQRQGFISRQGRDEAANAAQVASADVALAQARLDKTRIVAPFDGEIGLRNVSVGDYVTVGQDLVTLQAIQSLKVDFRIPELYLPQIRPGQKLKLFFDALPGQSWEGEVAAISPLVDVDGRALVMRARVDNQSGTLRPGMFARVDLLLAEQSALMVPETALQPRGGSQFIFRIDNGIAKEVPVVVGQRHDGLVQISGEVASGDLIVVAGLQKIRDGSRVRTETPNT